jgi:hypothetical protein
MSSKTKTIRYRGGIVEFQLPADWREEYAPEGGAMFYEDRPNSGTLRLDVLTAESKNGGPSDQGIDRAFPAGSYELLASGLRMRRRTVKSEERGTQIHLHRWEIVVPVPPRRFRIVCFTHTLLASQELEPASAAELAFLDHSIRSAEFSTADGVSGNYHDGRDA